MKAELERARTESHDKIRLLEEKLATTQTELNTIVTQKAELDKEHEDLLVMLTEQDAKVVKYKVFSRIYCFFIVIDIAKMSGGIMVLVALCALSCVSYSKRRSSI